MSTAARTPMLSLFLIVIAGFAVFGCGGGSSSSDGDESPEDQTVCNPLQGLVCRANQFCQFSTLSCGMRGELGACEQIPTECNNLPTTVCGCDGVSHSNICIAAQNGVSLLGLSACCSLAQGLGSPCGGPSSIACAGGLYCNFEDGSCGEGGELGVCTEIVLNCPLTPDPICGCDGNTYQNFCFAQAAAVSGRYRGVCN